MSIDLIQNFSEASRAVFYCAESIFFPTTIAFDAKEFIKGSQKNDQEKVWDHAVNILNIPVSTGYAAASAALSFETLTTASAPVLHVLGIATGALGMGSAALTLIPEVVGALRSLRFRSHIHASTPNETLDWVKNRYLTSEVGKLKLERRIGQWLTKEIEENKLSSKEVVEQLDMQSKKKLISHSLGAIALIASIVAFTALFIGFSFVHLFPLYLAFGVCLVAKYVIDNGIFEHKGWDIDKAALVPEVVKDAFHGLSCVFNEGCKVLINALSVEKAVPLSVKSSS